PIDHAGERSAEAIDLSFCAHGCEGTIAHGDCVGVRVGPVTRPDAIHPDDQRSMAILLEAQCAAGKLGLCLRVHEEISACDQWFAVHEEMLQSRSKLSRPIEGCCIAKYCRIEHHDVGSRTGAEDASIGQPKDFGG